MKFNLNFEYDKLHLKEITILIPKYHPNLVSFLTPILGLYGINVKEFINDFEEKTKFIRFDVIIPTRVRISKIKTYTISVKTPYLVSIISNIEAFSIDKPNVTALTFYKLSLIKSIVFNNYRSPFTKKIYLSIRKYLSNVTQATNFVSVQSAELNSLNAAVNLLNIKKNIHNIIFYKRLVFNKFGVFITFNNFNNTYLNYLANFLSLLGLNINKVKPRIVNSFVAKEYFYGSVYYISSPALNNSFALLKQIANTKDLGNLFVMWYKINSNLIPLSFFKAFAKSFSRFNILYLLRALAFVSNRLVKLSFFLHIKLLKLLNYNANLSSNTQKS